MGHQVTVGHDGVWEKDEQGAWKWTSMDDRLRDIYRTMVEKYYVKAAPGGPLAGLRDAVVAAITKEKPSKRLEEICYDLQLYYEELNGPITARVTEESPDSRPKCIWNTAPKGAPQPVPCGSEEKVYEFHETGIVTPSPVCQRHLPDAIRERDYNYAVPLDLPTGKRDVG